MPNKERIRESLTGLPTLEYLMQRIELGWRPAVIERDGGLQDPAATRRRSRTVCKFFSVCCPGVVEFARKVGRREASQKGHAPQVE